MTAGLAVAWFLSTGPACKARGVDDSPPDLERREPASGAAHGPSTHEEAGRDSFGSPASVVAPGEDYRLVDRLEFLDLQRRARDEPTATLWVGEPTTIAEAPWGRFVRVPWRIGQEFGFGWHVIVTDTARLAVVGAARTREFDELLQEAAWPVLAAINGGFFDENDAPLDLIRASGREVHRLRRDGGSGVFTVSKGRADIVHRSERTDGAEHALQSIDRLILDGRSLIKASPGASGARAARSAVAITAEGVELVVVAHGESLRRGANRADVRFASGFGLTLGELADYLLAASSADKALNLDGGPSVQLRVKLGAHELVLDGGGPTASAIVVVDR